MEPIERINQVRIGHGTHAGMTGKHNEDSYGFFAWKDNQGRLLHLGVVADGIGGQTAGELASSLAVQTVKDYFDRQHSTNNMSRHLERAIMTANMAVYQHSQANPQFAGMGTTIVLVAFVEDQLYIASVGDSRIYLLRNGNLQQLSIDHTWAQEAIEAGLLTHEQAKVHPNRNVIKRYLGGTTDVEVDHRLVLDPSQPKDQAARNQGTRLQKGDLLLLCSDGLTDMITDASLFATLMSQGRLQDAVDELIDKANDAGGKDNITVVAMRLPGGTVAAAPGRPAGPSRSLGLGIPLILGALLLLLLLGAGGAGAYFFFNRPDPTPTSTVTAAPPTATVPATEERPAEIPATAAALPATSIVGPEEGSPTASPEPQATPDLIPTERPRLTDTPVPPPTRRPTLTPTATDVGGSGGTSPTNTPRPATNTPRPPTNTPLPPNTNTPTNTPVTPTNTPVPPTNTPVPPTNTPIPSDTPITPVTSTINLIASGPEMLSDVARIEASLQISLEPLVMGALGWLMVGAVFGGHILVAKRQRKQEKGEQLG